MTLACSNLTVRRGDVAVLHDVQLALPRGSLHAVVGPNGAGKSSLLAALAGELPAEIGTVSLAGRALSEWPAQALARQRALLSQRPEVPFALAAWQLVRLGRLPHATSPEEDDAAVQTCLDRLGLLSFMARDVSRLSGGEAQRVHLARVLAQLTTPANHVQGWLLLDEPTAALDLGRSDRALGLIRQLCVESIPGETPDPASHTGLGAVVVLHDLGLALRHADTVVVLHEGRCVAQGKPRAVLTPALVAEVWGVEVSALRDDRGTVVALVPRHGS